MFCDRCKKSNASVHLTEIIKNVKSEVHLCESCAREIGLNSKLSSFSLSIPDMLSFLDNDSFFDSSDLQVCRSCGSSLLDINRSNRMGCPDCYETFSEMVDQLIKSVDPRFSGHNGSIPANRYVEKSFIPLKQAAISESDDLLSLKTRLDKAVEEENYEEAALLRDRIKALSFDKEENYI